MDAIRNLPIGIQSFEDIINKHCIYVDKTRCVYELASVGKPYFLSRPRRFGKSLLVSTLKAYFEGRSDLFENLYLAKLEPQLAEMQNRQPWQKYPVLHLDFSLGNYNGIEEFKKSLDDKLLALEDQYKPKWIAANYADRFANVIKAAKEQTGMQAVVLIDEYDKPLLKNLGNSALMDQIRTEQKAFFGVLKACDEYLRFVFITGVTRFDKVSIFSDLNNLNDISMDRKFSEICGITKSELTSTFHPEIEQLAESEELTYEECLAELKKNYDGYHFHPKSENIYNPFSVLNAFYKCEFDNYWFQSGTPSALVTMMKNQQTNLPELDGGICVDNKTMGEYRLDENNPIPMLYQSGYLTIKGYDKAYKQYTLGFPNNEVKYSFLNYILPIYTEIPENSTALNVKQFCKDVKLGNVDEFMNRIQTIFELAPKPSNQKYYELNVQQFVWLIFTLMGEFIQCEVRAGKGICDAVVWGDNAIYVFEFKINQSVEAALTQIDDKQYPIQFTPDGRQVVKIGANYDTAKGELKYIKG